MRMVQCSDLKLRFRGQGARLAGGALALVPAAALFALPHSARADFYLHHWRNQHEGHRSLRLSIDAGLYATKENFDGTGARFVPTGFDQYQRIQTDVFASYGLSPRVSVFGRLGWARAQLDSTTSLLRGSTFGFTDSTLGLNLRAYEFKSQDKPNGITLDVQLQGDFPPYSNQALTGPSLGDSTIDGTGGAFLTVPLHETRSSVLTLTGGAGYTYRTDSRSSAIPWSVSSTLQPKDQGVYLSAGAYGFQSLNTDPRAATITNATPAGTIAPLAGGSFVSGGVNPSLFTLRGEAGYQFGPDVSVHAFVSQSAWGQAAPNGFNAGVALTTRIGSQAVGNSARMSALDYGRSNKGFINYSTEAHVTRVNDRLNLVKIDKGTQDGVATGQVFDVFHVKKDGSVGDAVARGRVSAAQSNEAALTIEEYFKEVWIDEGFVAKRPVQ